MNLRLLELRFKHRVIGPDDDDKPAALGMVADPDGMVHPAPLTIDDCAAWVVAFMDGADGYEPVA